MAGEDITRSVVWQRAFAPAHDGLDEQRKVFSSALLKFRKRVSNLLTFIPGDMKHYTVHDISHLDALWEMADLLVGEQFSLNPAEAFVFGGAVLLHDAGMSVAAYPKGIQELEATKEWDDALAIARAKCAKDGQSAADAELDAKTFALTDILRIQHAKKAEELATQYWINPTDNSQEFLLEESELRSHYGPLIGTIAHSHHWGTRRLLSDLQPNLGAFDNTPATWAVDSVKVALLLRCADAAHIDYRRAPRLLFSLTRPVGLSLLHWSFQSKLAKPQIRDSKLLYTSKKAFGIEEVEAWQLCWDAIKMVDRELSDACDILADKKMPSFRVSGVVGAKAADSLARHVKVEGWRPVPTEIQVSDVPSLARTLGGNDLYSSAFAPLREMIQNSADAIDARIAIDSDFSLDEAKIIVKIGLEGDEIIFSVEDNGVGMSEKTLTGALIDFGMSFWRSESARQEFPGLHARFKPRGRYGIGFFSTFMWADCVKVASRKFHEGTADARVLEFSDGLGRRPILRNAGMGEASSKFSTKVTLRISKSKWEDLFKIRAQPFSYYLKKGFATPLLRPDKPEGVAVICGMLNIPVYLDDGCSSRVVNLPNWQTASPDDFVAFFEKVSRTTFDTHERKFSQAKANINRDGKPIGRAFLLPALEEMHAAQRSLLVYELGILVGSYEGARGVVGFIEGKAGNAARDKVEAQDIIQDPEWFQSQISYMCEHVEHVGEAIACQEAALAHGRIIRDLPLFLLNRAPLSLNSLIGLCKDLGRLRVAITHESHSESQEFRARKVDSPFPFIGKKIDQNHLYFLTGLPGTITGEDMVDDFIATGECPLAQVLRELKHAFGPSVQLRVKLADLDSYSRKQIMFLEFSEKSTFAN